MNPNTNLFIPSSNSEIYGLCANFHNFFSSMIYDDDLVDFNSNPDTLFFNGHIELIFKKDSINEFKSTCPLTLSIQKRGAYYTAKFQIVDVDSFQDSLAENAESNISTLCFKDIVESLKSEELENILNECYFQSQELHKFYYHKCLEKLNHKPVMMYGCHLPMRYYRLIIDINNVEYQVCIDLPVIFEKHIVELSKLIFGCHFVAPAYDDLEKIPFESIPLVNALLDKDISFNNNIYKDFFYPNIPYKTCEKTFNGCKSVVSDMNIYVCDFFDYIESILKIFQKIKLNNKFCKILYDVMNSDENSNDFELSKRLFDTIEKDEFDFSKKYYIAEFLNTYIETYCKELTE